MKTKQKMIDALRAFINQRSGIEFANYGNVTAFRAEQRSITKDLHHARELLRSVELAGGLDGNTLAGAFRAYSGRLSWDGARLTYTTGQYFPTEYRRAVCAVCAAALWDYYRDDYATAAKAGESAGDSIRRNFRRVYGRAMQMRWFD